MGPEGPHQQRGDKMHSYTDPENGTVAPDDLGSRGWLGANRIKPFLTAGAFVASFVLAAILVSVPYFTLPGEARAQSVECDRYAAQTGSDSNSGTYSAPYKTAEKLVRSLSAGQTGCLRGGTYTEGDNRVTVSNGGTSDT